MLKSFFRSREWALWAWGGLILLCALIVVEVRVIVWINGWYRETWDFLQTPDPDIAAAAMDPATDWSGELGDKADAALKKFWSLIGEFWPDCFSVHRPARLQRILRAALRLPLAAGDNLRLHAAVGEGGKRNRGRVAAPAAGPRALRPVGGATRPRLLPLGVDAHRFRSDFVGRQRRDSRKLRGGGGFAKRPVRLAFSVVDGEHSPRRW